MQEYHGQQPFQFGLGASPLVDGRQVIYCPGNLDRDNDVHEFLVQQGYRWSRFEEPVDGWRRKYWKRV